MGRNSSGEVHDRNRRRCRVALAIADGGVCLWSLMVRHGIRSRMPRKEIRFSSLSNWTCAVILAALHSASCVEAISQRLNISYWRGIPQAPQVHHVDESKSRRPFPSSNWTPGEQPGRERKIRNDGSVCRLGRLRSPHSRENLGRVLKLRSGRVVDNHGKFPDICMGFQPLHHLLD